MINEHTILKLNLVRIAFNQKSWLLLYKTSLDHFCFWHCCKINEKKISLFSSLSERETIKAKKSNEGKKIGLTLEDVVDADPQVDAVLEAEVDERPGSVVLDKAGVLGAVVGVVPLVGRQQ